MGFVVILRDGAFSDWKNRTNYISQDMLSKYIHPWEAVLKFALATQLAKIKQEIDDLDSI